MKSQHNTPFFPPSLLSLSLSFILCLAVMQAAEAPAPPDAADGKAPVAAEDTRGRHRISAELKRFENETRFLEEELGELEKVEKVSASCQEFLHEVESRSDPLLPITRGPANPSWDRWFEGPQDEHGCRCWIL